MYTTLSLWHGRCSTFSILSILWVLGYHGAPVKEEVSSILIIFKKEVNKLSKSTINQYDKILSKGYIEGIKGKELIALLSELTGENKKFFYNRWLEIKNKNE